MMMMMMMMFGCAPWILTLLILLFGLVLYLYIPYWKVRRVPGPPLIPIVGHLPLLLKHGPDVFTALAIEYGPIFRFHMGRQPLIIIADPELCREVCIKKFKDMPNRSKIPPASGSPLHEKNLFLSRDSRWSTMRNTIVALYQPSHLSNLIPIMQSFIDSTTRNLTTTKEEEDITFSNLSLMLAIDVLGQVAFGVDFGLSKGDSNSVKDDEVSRFIDAHIYSTQCLKMDMSGSLSIQLGLLFPFLQTPLRKFLRWIPWTTDHRMRSNEKKLCERLAQLIEMRASDKDHSSHNMLSVVLNARDSKVDAFTPDYVMGLAYEHLLAGSATTSFTLSMAIYLISKHPEVEEKLIREIDGFGDHNVTTDDLQSKFPFVDQVIKETMRFRSVSPLVARETNKEVKIGGYILPKGTWVWPALGVSAKDPKHFPEPHLFRPERFDPECEEQKRRHPYAHIPFGIGPRVCLGQKLALQELKLSLISIYRRFIFRHSDSMEDPLEFEYGLVVDFKHGIKLRVIKRDNQ